MQSIYVRKKIDKRIMPLLMWYVLRFLSLCSHAYSYRVYFLQILDKNCVGYAANFGLAAQTVSYDRLVYVFPSHTTRDLLGTNTV
jgi:hypothetical protein